MSRRTISSLPVSKAVLDDVCERLKAHIKAKYRTIEVAAAALGMSTIDLSDILRKQRRPTDKIMRDACISFEIVARNPPRIVCAAIRHESGEVITGIRHFDGVMFAQIQRDGRDWRQAEQGFVDAYGTFLDRKEAWDVAAVNKQIINDPDWFPGELHSEHLY